MDGHGSILELEINGKLVERVNYVGLLEMRKKIESFKEVYKLTLWMDYEFFYYKIPSLNKPFTDAISHKIYLWELEHGTL